jgi:hypothetical protein
MFEMDYIVCIIKMPVRSSSLVKGYSRMKRLKEYCFWPC